MFLTENIPQLYCLQQQLPVRACRQRTTLADQTNHAIICMFSSWTINLAILFHCQKTFVLLYTRESILTTKFSLYLQHIPNHPITIHRAPVTPIVGPPCYKQLHRNYPQLTYIP